jgi:signal transduction histidine kinase
MDEESRWKKRFERERKARKEAETVLEEKSFELFSLNEELNEFNLHLEKTVKDRTRELEKLNSSLEKRVEVETKKRVQQEHILLQQSKTISMGEVVQSIAHHWRQPINVISLLVSDMLETYEFDELSGEYIEDFIITFDKNINLLTTTIDEFTNFFNISECKEIINLKTLFEKVIVVYFQRDLAIQIDVECEECTEINIFNFKNELKQVALSLITNSREAILINKSIKKYIKVLISQNEKNVFIKIRDSGGGISEEYQDKIFDAYFTTKESSGSGLGLYISQTIVEVNLGGKLYFKNLKDGAEFTIELQK